MLPHWQLADDLLGGTTAMRAAGRRRLPQWPKEPDDTYAARLAVSVLFPAYKRTISTLAGKPFSKAIARNDDVSSGLHNILDDIDGEGRNVDAFAADLMEDALGKGLAGILVDFPQNDAQRNGAGLTTLAAEQAAGLRPYWVHVRANQILGWRARRVGALWMLAQLRLLELVEEQDGEFGTKDVEQVRVLEPGKWTTYRRGKSAVWEVYASGTTTLGIVPFVPVYGERTGFLTAKPPLVEVAHLNVAHWQSASDQQNILHVTRVPILTATNVRDRIDPTSGALEPWELTVGAGVATRIEGEGASLSFTEHSGAGIGAGRDDLKDLEERMRQAGAELLVLEPGKVTATQVQTENAVGMCALQRITLALQDALNLALDYTAMWLKEPTAGTLTLFNDFGVASLAEASAQLLQERNLAGKLSDETTHREFQRRGIISADVDWDKERQRIEDQGPALGTLNERQPAAA